MGAHGARCARGGAHGPVHAIRRAARPLSPSWPRLGHPRYSGQVSLPRRHRPILRRAPEREGFLDGYRSPHPPPHAFRLGRPPRRGFRWRPSERSAARWCPPRHRNRGQGCPRSPRPPHRLPPWNACRSPSLRSRWAGVRGLRYRRGGRPRLPCLHRCRPVTACRRGGFRHLLYLPGDASGGGFAARPSSLDRLRARFPGGAARRRRGSRCASA